MALSGFEGFEKRLELHFFGDDPITTKTTNQMGLRLLNFESLVQVLNAVQCTIVSAVSNRFLDAYVLSESSLFVYPTKIIIKTCGTTQVLKSIRPLLAQAHLQLGLTCTFCRYTRGSFIFPNSQPFPHKSFKDEVLYIEDNLPKSLCYRKASVMPSKIASHSWHVFTATTDHPSHVTLSHHDPPLHVYTIEVCMTELDRVLARKFFQTPGSGKNGDVAGKEMTKLTRIGEINPRAVICDFAFDPCGYSMNGIDNDRYSTIHVTPEDGYSYASFECVGFIFDDDDDDDDDDVADVLRKVVKVFRPGTMSVSATSSARMGRELCARVARAIESIGLKRRSCAVDELPEGGSVVFQTFTTRRK